ncbi:right-handed parallel beta-helix repeat-containing protein, partial [Saccharibacillus kuerlensis]
VSEEPIDEPEEPEVPEEPIDEPEEPEVSEEPVDEPEEPEVPEEPIDEPEEPEVPEEPIDEPEEPEVPEEPIDEPEEPEVPVKGLSVMDFGAIANDDNDDYEAFAAAAEEARSKNEALHIPEGEFKLGKILKVDGIRMEGVGKDKTLLVSTDPENGSIDLLGDGVQIRNFKHAYQTTVPRGNGSHDKNSITVRSATNFVIDNIHVDRSSTAGIMIAYGSSDGTISNNTVENTGADGIHMTTESHDIKVVNNRVSNVGDDGIAVVSYGSSKVPVRDILIKDNWVGNFSKARGISVVGGEDVRIEGNEISDTMMAGVYIAAEGSYNTLDVHRVQVNNNTIDSTGIKKPENHPNVLVYASHGVVDDVKFYGNLIQNGAHRGIGVWGQGEIGDVVFERNTLINVNGSATTFENGNIKLIDNIGF